MPVNADLGDADQDTSVKDGTTYDALCGKAKKDCKISFVDGRMKVNDGGGILPRQIARVQKSEICRKKGLFGMSGCTNSYGTMRNLLDKEFTITYRDSDTGENKSALITFLHTETSERFMEDIINFGGLSESDEAITGKQRREMERELRKEAKTKSILQGLDNFSNEMNKNNNPNNARTCKANAFGNSVTCTDGYGF